jgi:hypothetical protein
VSLFTFVLELAFEFESEVVGIKSWFAQVDSSRIRKEGIVGIFAGAGSPDKVGIDRAGIPTSSSPSTSPKLSLARLRGPKGSPPKLSQSNGQRLQLSSAVSCLALDPPAPFEANNILLALISLIELLSRLVVIGALKAHNNVGGIRLKWDLRKVMGGDGSWSAGSSER